MDITLIIPTLNEKENIRDLLDEIEKSVNDNFELSIIFVDDGSTDGTPELIKYESSRRNLSIDLIERRSRGLASAVIRGMEKAVNADAYIVMDADLSHPGFVIPKLAEKAEHADIVIASRNMQGGGVEEWPWYRKFYSVIATRAAKIFDVRSTDPMSGYFLVKRDILDLGALSPVGYKILFEILVKSRPKKVAEVPYIFRNRAVGSSKMNWRVVWHYIVHLFRLYRWKRLNN